MKIQIAKICFLTALGIMKKILDLGEFKLGKKTDDYKYFKKEIMDYFYNSLQALFSQLEKDNILDRCQCKARLRQGFQKCPSCGGSGFRNKIEN